jgi:hypothetical protein
MTALIIPTRPHLFGPHAVDRNLGATGTVRAIRDDHDADQAPRVDGIDRIDAYRDRAGRSGAFAARDYPRRYIRGEQIQAELHRLPIPRHRALTVITEPTP